MNTGNLQIEGLILALGALNRALVEKGIFSRADIEQLLHEAEALAASDERFAELPPANRDAVCFPIRALRVANSVSENQVGFSDLARTVGVNKQPYNDQR